MSWLWIGGSSSVRPRRMPCTHGLVLGHSFGDNGDKTATRIYWNYGANNSPNVSSTAAAVAESSLPSRFTRRTLSTVRI